MTEHIITEHIEGAGHANKTRSLVKTLTWRTIATTDTIIIARIITGSWTVGFGIASIEVVTKMALYYLHERGWSAMDWGLEDVDVDVDALAKQESVKAAEIIAPQAAEIIAPQTTQFNVNIVNKEYTDSVHQGEK